MTNRLLFAVALAGALVLQIGSITVAAPADAQQVIANTYRAGGVIAKVQVAFDAGDWPLLRSYVDQYVAMMRSVTVQVKDLSARGVVAGSAFEAVQQATLKHMTTLRKLHGTAPAKEVKDLLARAIEASQSAYDASGQAIAKTER